MSQILANTLKMLMVILLTILGLSVSFSLSAHGVDEATKQFLILNEGISILPFIYIGAKHMVTGYDHLLFLVGVIFSSLKVKMYCSM